MAPRSRRAILGAAALAGGFAIGGGSAFVTRMGMRYDGRFLPGTMVEGVDVSDLKPSEAAVMFDNRWRDYLANPVVFRAPDRDWRPSAADIGIKVDYLNPLRKAYVWGRSGGIFQRTREQTQAAASARNWPITFEFDQAKLRTYLQSVASMYFQPFNDAEVALQGEDLRFREARSGVELDWQAALPLVNAPGAEAGIQEIEIPLVQTLPTFTTGAARQLVSEVERLAETPLVLEFEGAGWFIPQAQLRQSISIDNSGDTLVATIERSRLQPLFDEIDNTLGFEAIDGKLTYDPETNRVTEFQPWSDGRGLDHRSLFDRVLLAARTGQPRVEIPIVGRPATRSTPDAEDLGISELLAAGDSLFINSAGYRITNISNGSGLLHGAVVMPGEIFSFNEYLGPIEYDRGFIDGLVIIDDSTEDAIGGGICQVSTTMFRAAFWAGLPILERHKHLYRVRYYEQGGYPIGFDASIWQPSLDVKFMNDTDGAIMVRTLFDRRRQSLRFELWGKPTGRTVEVSDHQLTDWVDSPPDQWVIDPEEEEGFKEQTEWAVEGVFATLKRRVMVGDEIHLEDAFYSSFTPWPNRYTVSPNVAVEEAPEAYAEWIAAQAAESEEVPPAEDEGSAPG
jgi:vancomycin resistance protein YoaR